MTYVRKRTADHEEPVVQNGLKRLCLRNSTSPNGSPPLPLPVPNPTYEEEEYGTINQLLRSLHFSRLERRNNNMGYNPQSSMMSTSQ